MITSEQLRAIADEARGSSGGQTLWAMQACDALWAAATQLDSLLDRAVGESRTADLALASRRKVLDEQKQLRAERDELAANVRHLLKERSWWRDQAMKAEQ